MRDKKAHKGQGTPRGKRGQRTIIRKKGVGGVRKNEVPRRRASGTKHKVGLEILQY